MGLRQLTKDEQRLVSELQQRDRAVRAHEAAHQAAAGSLGGPASFTYETGPDGKSYAVGGEVPINISGGDSPQESIARAQQVRAAALAPPDPSAADLAVAARAADMEMNAQRQLLQQRTQGSKLAHRQAWRPPVLGAHEAKSASGSTSVQAGSVPSASTAGVASSSTGAEDQSANAQSTLNADVGYDVAITCALLESLRSQVVPGSARATYLGYLCAAAYRS